MSYRRLKEEVKPVSVEEWNLKMQSIQNDGVPVQQIYNENDRPKGRYIAYFMIKGVTQFILWVNEGGLKKSAHIVKYMARADDNPSRIVTVNPIDAYKRFRQYYKDFPNTLEYKESKHFRMGGLQWQNPEYNDVITEAISYDINSAFLWGLTQDMPVNIPSTAQREHQPLLEGNIGITEITHKLATHPGTMCCYQWEAGRPEGIRRYADVVYNERFDETLTKEQRKERKQIPSVVVGFLNNRCWPLRYIAILQTNHRMEQLLLKLKYKTPKKSPVLYVNTDCIIIRKEAEQEFIELLKQSNLDVDSIGEGLGQFKRDHAGRFWYDGANCRWLDENNNVVEEKIRGPKKESYIYHYDTNKKQLVNLLEDLI